MLEFRPCQCLAQAALPPRKIPFPDLLGVPVFLAVLELLRPWPWLPPLRLLPEAVGRRTAGLGPPLDDRRRCQCLFSCERRCEPGMTPPRTAVRPAGWHGAQGSPPC